MENPCTEIKYQTFLGVYVLGDWISFQPAIVVSRLDLMNYDTAPSAGIRVEREGKGRNRLRGSNRLRACEVLGYAAPHQRAIRTVLVFT